MTQEEFGSFVNRLVLILYFSSLHDHLKYFSQTQVTFNPAHILVAEATLYGLPA